MPWVSLLLAIGSLVVSADEYRERRARLRAAIPDAAIVLEGAPDTSGDPRSPMLQEPNFYYLTGWKEPGAVLVILPASVEPNEILFLPPRSERKERYEGHRVAAGDADATSRTGFAKVMSTDVWEAEVSRLMQDGNVPRRMKLAEAAPVIAKLRMVKSRREVDMIQHSIDVSIEAHLAAWRRAKAGLFEYQLAATMTQVMMEQGCERHAYRPVVGSGPNSVILHYGFNHRRMDSGELVLMDVGAECNAYAADITRTIPVSGRFTPRQRELYELVLGAQKAAIAAVKPGASMGSRGEVVEAAKKYLDTHGKPIHGKPLSTYLTHGIGHHVGLEVHDASADVPLAAGMVVTIEPGLYIAEENTGIRIEDMVLVTETGAKVLSSALPRSASDVERRMQH
ncbi:MAG: aminopeptidase P family protein [Acidobacteria bacterium]|nr:aminopeptidase P family protein [Acidobacteriota bacterium]